LISSRTRCLSSLPGRCGLGRGPANGFANETARTGETLRRARDGHRPSSLVSETDGHARDQKDARRMSHNPEVALDRTLAKLSSTASGSATVLCADRARGRNLDSPAGGKIGRRRSPPCAMSQLP